MFFSFLAVFPLPESYQNDPKFHFNTLLRSDTQKSSKNVENTTRFWSRCETVFGPPPAKADIATAILTNVIEHLVLLLPPNKHAFTAKAVWADFKPPSSGSTYCSSSSNLLARKKTTLQTSTDMLFWVSKKMPDLLGWDSTGHAPVVPGDKKFSIPGAMADSCIARGMLRDTQWAWPKTSIKIKDSNLWPFWMNNLVILS